MANNFTKTSVKDAGRVELHDALSLTGAEVSINAFVHAHKQNEEIYGILDGAGRAEIDGEVVPLAAGDWLRISPSAKRRFFAGEESGIRYICIQVKENSLASYTAQDAIIG